MRERVYEAVEFILITARHWYRAVASPFCDSAPGPPGCHVNGEPYNTLNIILPLRKLLRGLDSFYQCKRKRSRDPLVH